MAGGPLTQISDVIVPRIFAGYVQQRTEEKSRLIQSGAVERSQMLDNLLSGGGKTFDVPSWRDLDSSDADRVSTDTPHAEFTGGSAEPDPFKIQTSDEVAVRLSRNASWSAADLAAPLAGSDPIGAIGDRVGYYWERRMQAAFIATINGIFADNAAAPAASEHVQNDMTHDITGASFVDGVTNFSAEAFLNAALTMGDSMDDLVMVMFHSVVYNTAQRNNLIDFIPDARGEVQIPTFLGRMVIVDDTVPSPSSGIFNSWLFGRGAVMAGMGSPKVPVEVERKAGAGNGGGQEVLYNRTEWIMHPVGNAYVGTAPNGGPSNAATTNNLAAAGSWQRVYPERKQIKIARLLSREF